MGPFAQSSDHLLAELERIDLMIRSRVAELRRVQSEDENFRGLYISEQEIDALLTRPIGRPQWLHAIFCASSRNAASPLPSCPRSASCSHCGLPIGRVNSASISCSEM